VFTVASSKTPLLQELTLVIKYMFLFYDLGLMMITLSDKFAILQ